MKCLYLIVVLIIAGCSSLPNSTPYQQGKKLLETTFDPARIFDGDLNEHSNDQLLLTIVTSKRDDYLPDYSLAIAFQMIPSEDGQYQVAYSTRMLRVKANDASLGRLSNADKLEWLETKMRECDGAIAAMEGVRNSNWQPDIHFGLVDLEDREVILHPAMMRVRMTGNYTTTTYQGWRHADGVPSAVKALVSKLEPCWRPSNTVPPWKK